MSTSRKGPRPALPAAEVLAHYIDHTLLAPAATRKEIDRLCREAVEYGFKAVCVNPVFTAAAAASLQREGPLVCTVVGFPLGCSLPSSKAHEAGYAVEAGAREIDMVIHVGALKAGDYKEVVRDIQAVERVCREGGALLKVILETALLTDEEKRLGCRAAVEAGAAFVKTSTGFGPGGATCADVRLLRRETGATPVLVKASGGIATCRQACSMIEAGAARIGTSSGVRIITEARQAAREE
ncbi:deoxyribose-phosphate aldolase [bacterium]|nr:deoxyribose-phosphate aldolase [bacterium]